LAGTAKFLIGVFGGAFLAFQLEASRRKREREDGHFLSAKRAQLALSAQLNVLLGLKKQALDGLEHDPNRHVKLHPMLGRFDAPTIDMNSLIFVADSENASLLNELIVAQDSFHTVIAVLNKRNDVHEAFQKGVPKGHSPDLSRLEVTLRSLTDGLYQGINHADEKIQGSFQALADFMRERFPGRRIGKLDFP
jgi:hypothetical protein